MNLLPWLLLPSALAAEAAPDLPSAPATYALVVGSNRPGPGQTALQYADDDAARIAAVLTEVGGVPAQHLVRLDDPDADSLLLAIDGFGEVIANDAAQGRRTAFVFYYSGHARAQGLDLGSQSVPLSELRARLEALDATVTLAMLDACQSGAVTDAKGVAPAADFSTSSIAGLATEGFAVIASSSDTELSQESTQLQGGIFTHHLAGALRGAADDDGDGVVTLDEAYRYAYDRTLVTTAATAIGAQHVTLQTDLRGQGAFVLTRPVDATAHLRLPAALDADVMLVSLPNERVVAEVHKAPGRSFELALPPGDYAAIVRQGAQAERCTVTLGSGRTELPTTGCEPIEVQTVAARGDTVDLTAPYETFFVEHALGSITDRNDPYYERLTDFGFGDPKRDSADAIYNGQLAFGLRRHFSVIAGFGHLNHESTSREVYAVAGDEADEDINFGWIAWRLGAYGRAQLPLADEWIVPYAQAGGGIAWGRTRWRQDGTEEKQRYVGPQLSGGLGLQLMPRIGNFRGAGLYWQTELVTASIIKNLLGDRHDSGGLVHQLGIRGGF